MVKYLDETGLAYFYQRLKEQFILRNEVRVKEYDGCPHCGAPFGETDVCEYCKSQIGGYKMIYRAMAER